MKAHPVTGGMTRVVVPAMALATMTAPGWAGAVGGEFLVNTYTSSDQEYPSLGMDASGNFVIAWDRNGQDGSGRGVYAQRDGVGGADGLDGAHSVTVLLDGAHVYAPGNDDHAVAMFLRDGVTGVLTFVAVSPDGVGSAWVTHRPCLAKKFPARGSPYRVRSV